ncbi:MAG: MFS transporter [Chitinophagales bacterium]|nr:MFS transporter [Chitinophagales bacterium]
MSAPHQPYASLQIKDFRWYLLARMCLTMAWQMQGVIVGWQVYEFTKDPFALGLVGLAEVLPFIVTSFYGGHAADTIERKKLVLVFTTLYLFCAVCLMSFTFPFVHVLDHHNVYPIYIIIAITGIARGFVAPAITAFLAQLIPRELYSNGVTWNSNTWHMAAVAGPAAGGLLYGFVGITAAYAIVCALMFSTLILFLFIKRRPLPVSDKQETIFESLTTGIRFVFGNQIMLGALSLDMFAVLFGGAVAMLPVFASDILKVGPEGLGVMRAAPFFGSIIMGLFIAHRPPMNKAGKNLLIALVGFGSCMILFALSKNFYLSLFLLFLSGAFDNISVIIRGTILQLITPDHMRGRVSAINSIFIGSSNEMGAFESGAAAKFMGLVPSVIFGGVMTILIVGFTSVFAPKLRALSLRELHERNKI